METTERDNLFREAIVEVLIGVRIHIIPYDGYVISNLLPRRIREIRLGTQRSFQISGEPLEPEIPIPVAVVPRLPTQLLDTPQEFALNPGGLPGRRHEVLPNPTRDGVGFLVHRDLDGFDHEGAP